MEVKSISIDHLVEQYDLAKCCMIKLDVEGAEHLAILGAMRTIEKFKPVICMEVNDPYTGSSDLKADELLVSMGYSRYLICDQLKAIDQITKPHHNVFYVANKPSEIKYEK